MKLLRFAAIALLGAITMVACDDDTTTTVVPPTSVTIVGTVSGTVGGGGSVGAPVGRRPPGFRFIVSRRSGLKPAFLSS